MRRHSWIFLLSALGLPALAIIVGVEAWPFELAYHFTAHLAVLAALAGAIWAVAGRRGRAFAAGALAAAYTVTSVTPPVAMPGGAVSVAVAAPSASVDRATAVTLVSFNVLASQEEPSALLAWLATGPADVLVLVEATSDWRDRLAVLERRYPHRVFALPRGGLPPDADYDLFGSTGIAVLSRLPLSDVRIFYPAGPIKPAVTAKVTVGTGGFTLVAVHPTSPLTPAGHAGRNEYLAALPGALAGTSGPLVVAGDFNTTHLSPPFRRFLDRLGLDAPRSPPATYPAFAGPFGLPIDHVLVRGMSVRGLEPLSPRGSDHRGLLATLGLPVGAAPN